MTPAQYFEGCDGAQNSWIDGLRKMSPGETKLLHFGFVCTFKNIDKSEASHWRKCPQSQMKNTGRSSSEVLRTCGDQEQKPES